MSNKSLGLNDKYVLNFFDYTNTNAKEEYCNVKIQKNRSNRGVSDTKFYLINLKSICLKPLNPQKIVVTSYSSLDTKSGKLEIEKIEVPSSTFLRIIKTAYGVYQTVKVSKY